MANLPSIDDFPSLADLELALNDQDHRCIYYLLSKGRRCESKPNAADRAEAARLRRSFDPPAVQHVDIEILKEFARLNCCKRSHRHKLDDIGLIDPLALRWQAELRALTITPRTLATMTLHAGSRPSIPQQQQRYDLRSRSAPQDSSSSVTGTTTTNAPTPGFRPHIVRPSHTVATVLAKPLTPRDQLSGILYLYTRASSPGFVKIGLTRDTIQARFNKWCRQCGYTPSLAASFPNVPHIYRVEQLVHFELAAYWRVEKQCQQCPRQHKEWFEIAATEAASVAGRWAKWMTVADPYELCGTLKESWKKAILSLQAAGITVTAQALLDTHNTQQRRTRTPTEIGSARIRSSVAVTVALAGGLRGETIADSGSLETERVATPSADISAPDLELGLPADAATATATANRTFEDCVKAIADTIQALTKQQQDDLVFELIRRSSAKEGDAADQVSTLNSSPGRPERHNTNPTLTACA